MKKSPYLYKQQGFERFVFSSVGKTNIIKLVEFSTTSTPGVYNLGFGDLLPDGTIDDKANSNNGDIVLVLVTIVQIIIDFTSKHPDAKIVFAGSTHGRTNLYARILKLYYQDFSKEFRITALIRVGRAKKEVDFNPNLALTYLAFFIKKIN
jgi:hypothetical protein